MKRLNEGSERLTYFYLTLLNLCVAGMFFVLLTPEPEIQRPIEANVAAKHVIATRMPVKRAPITGTPIRVVVPSVGIDVKVKPGAYDVDAQTWAIDHHSAFHADITVPANNSNGTTLIYGHAGWDIFTSLPKVSEPAEAFVDTAEGITFIYSFESNRQVDPADVSVLTPAGPPMLVLQTCSGAFDAYRTLVTFSFKGVIRSE